MKVTIDIPSAEAVPVAAHRFVEAMGTHKVFAFLWQDGGGEDDPCQGHMS